MFSLDSRLTADTLPVCDLPLSRALLMNNAFFPWLVLVPRVKDAREILDLAQNERHQLMEELAQASRVMQEIFAPDKLNIAALGNQVPQLHVHVIARYRKDTAWPNPVWGLGSEPYADPLPILQQLKVAFVLPS